MGCDIHPVIEVLEDGDWTAVQSERFQDYDERPVPINSLGSRNYHRFSILADVRNNYREHKVTALFPDRGLPSGCSGQSSEELADDGDIHSVTYFTLRELIDVDWDADATPAFQVGIFGDTYQYYLEHKRLPADWEEDWGGDRRQVDVGEMQLLLISGNGLPTIAPGTRPYLKGRLVKSGPVVVVSCPITYRQIDPWLKNDLIPALQAMGDPDKVRVVIGFDN